MPTPGLTSRLTPSSFLPLIGIALFLSAAVATLGSQSLSASEANLLVNAVEHPPLGGASPLTSWLLQAVSTIGPPAELSLRILGLLLLVLGAVAGRTACLQLMPSSKQGKLAGLMCTVALISHGGLLIAATTLGPIGWIWGAEAALCLAALLSIHRDRASALRRLSLFCSAMLAVLVEPLLSPFVFSIALWLVSKRRRPEGALVAAAGCSSLALGSSSGWISSPTLVPHGPELLASVVGVSSTQSHPTVLVLGQTLTLLLAGLALVGPGRIPRDLKLLMALITISAALVIAVRPEGASPGMIGVLAAPPLLILACCRIAQMDHRRSVGLLWLFVVLAPPPIAGLHAVLFHRHEPTRALASSVDDDEELSSSNEGLARAVDFYRRSPQAKRSRPVKLRVPGDRTPRRVAVEAFGDAHQLTATRTVWLMRPQEPVYDFGLNLPSAKVVYQERGKAHRFRWQTGKGRFVTDGPRYQRVMWSFAPFNSVEEDALLLHPLDDGVLELRWENVPRGHHLIGVAGVDDRSIDYALFPIRVEVLVDGQSRSTFTRGERRGLHPFRIDTPGDRPLMTVTFRVTAEDDRGRHLFLDALAIGEDTR